MPIYFLDARANRFWCDGVEIILTRMEYKLISFLWLNKGKILLFQTIIDELWGSVDYEYDVHVLYSTINRVRNKLPNLIETRRGLGYGILSV